MVPLLAVLVLCYIGDVNKVRPPNLYLGDVNKVPGPNLEKCRKSAAMNLLDDITLKS
jgi:hypothetical protein